MSRIVALSLSVVLLLGLLLSLSPRVGESQEAVTLPAEVEVIASGLTNPRGFAWGANGELYPALAGTGGPDRIVREGTPRPFMIGLTSSIVRVDGGCAVPVAGDLPSRLLLTPGWIWGAMEVAILDGQLYALLGGGGPTNGQPDWPIGVYRVLADGSTELVALEAGNDRLWISEAVSGRLLTATTDAQLALVADLSEGHMVPTGIVLDDTGGAYVSHETVVPYPEGASKVIHVSPDGRVTDQWTGLTAGTGPAMGPDGALYAAEMATNNTDEPPYLRPNSGRLDRGRQFQHAFMEPGDYAYHCSFHPA